MELISETRCFDGRQLRFRHDSSACNAPMVFAAFVPAQARRRPAGALYWLSGLTCTDENFMQKAGAQRYAAKHGLVLIAPDTSPRATGTAGEDDDWDLGTGAGFYVNATHAPWSAHYQMYDYVVEELPALVESELPVQPGMRAISGHSMGGHGALTVALRNPERYLSVSAFAPICAPTRCPWGHKTLGAYLGDDREAWADYDASVLAARGGTKLSLLVDQGAADEFLEEQLMPQELVKACDAGGHSLELNMRAGYDHSYFFIASFIGEHIAYHAEALAAAGE